MKNRPLLVILLSILVLSACQTTRGAGDGDTVRKISFETGVDFPAAGRTRTGTLVIPANSSGKIPAVIMVHGTAGPDERYAHHTQTLVENGYAVFQMDFKSGIFTGPSDRIGTRAFIPMTGAALKILRKQPEIDPDHIAIMGFSFGGALTREVFHANFREFQMDGKRAFSAHVAFYPQCRFGMGEYKNKLPRHAFAGGKMLIIAGSEDSYGDAKDCPLLLQEFESVEPGKVELQIIPGAHHGFDGTVSATFFDPIAINQLGKAQPNRAARDEATRLYLTFLAENI